MVAEQWLRIAVSVPTEAVEAVSYFLVELGSIGIAEGEWRPDTPPPAWTLVQGFFSRRPGTVRHCWQASRHISGVSLLSILPWPPVFLSVQSSLVIPGKSAGKPTSPPSRLDNACLFFRPGKYDPCNRNER